MKKLYILTLAAAMLITTSCDDFLATDTPSKQSNTNVFNTEAMAEAALMGVYATMSDTYVYGQKISVNWQNISDTENCNLYLTNYKEVNSDYGQNHYYGNSGNSTTRWNNIFRFAELASAAVEGMRGGELLKTNPTVGKPLLGEALTLRALAYFELVRIYGDIPYKKTTSNSDLSNVYIGKIDRDTVYADLVKNLQEAIEYLPWLGSGKASTAERISKGFAKGLLARVALFAGGWSLRDGNQFPDMQLEKHPTIPEMNGYYVGRVKNYKEYYEIAAKQCAEILGDPENPHQLDPDFENIWKTVNHLDQNPYNENLYEYNKANKEGFNEVVFLNIYGNIAEGATSNIFIIKDKKIYTPKISDGILPGVVRNWVIKNFRVCEKHLDKEDLYSADEVFITNSILGIMKIVQFEERSYSTSMVERIRSEYEQFII